jgi:amino acid adenylation domain-containing protein
VLPQQRLELFVPHDNSSSRTGAGRSTLTTMKEQAGAGGNPCRSLTRPELSMTQNVLPQRFLRGLSIAPRAEALRVGARAVSYQELHAFAAGWAGALLHRVEGPGPIGVLCGPGVEAYAGILAALWTGRTVVPLHADFPLNRTRLMLEAAQVSVVLADDAGQTVLDRLAREGFTVAALPASAALRTAATALGTPVPARDADVAYILFTSGSTGRPKGVRLTHGNVRHYFTLADEHYDFTAEDVFSQTFPLNFDCAMFNMFCGWGAGASVQAVPDAAFRDLPGFVAERRMSVWFSAPSTIGLIRRMGGLAAGGLPTLRWSLFAGEAVHAADLTDWLGAASASAAENIYGPTELTVTVTGHRWSPATSPAMCVNGLVPIGTVHRGHQWVLLATGGQVSDQEGELCVTGPQMTPGYVDPADGAGRFLHRDGRDWYRTGDRVRHLGGGELVYLGRTDAQVQLRGWRVELAEVEHALRRCDGVDNAVAVTRTGVDGELELVIYHTGTPTPPAVLAKQLRDILPAGMIPRHFRQLDAFPLNSNRKIDRAALARDAAGGAP